ncbi:MAG TPA: dicarboxylate/amino acid:cation symporter [Polyangiaceae bacterium]|nr:dicarboxylate/amino acid:cation symporter [Polyangiaceae bacterium]
MVATNSVGGGPLRAWSRLPLYARILAGLVLGVAAGVVLGPSTQGFDVPAKLVLRVLGALAPVIVLLAVVNALMTAEVAGKAGRRLATLLVTNTLVAIVVGLGVANLVQPGTHANLKPPGEASRAPHGDFVTLLIDNVPDSFLRPLVENKVIGVVLIALAVGVAARYAEGERRKLLENAVGVAFDIVLRILHWTIALVPLAVFGKVATIIGHAGFAPFKALGAFVLAVLLALAIQLAYYLARIRLQSWLRPVQVLRGLRDAIVMAFSTASSTATMPVTYERLKILGLREGSASLGALVGSNFNNDGTALYEAMSALFVAQMLGHHLSLGEQMLIVLTSMVASVGAAGIPEAGLVTMTLVFTAVRLPTEYIALLLTVDWFLDRCRTVINLMGDVSVACVLDGKVRAEAAPELRGAG